MRRIITTVFAILVCAGVLAGPSQELVVGEIDGVIEVKPSTYSINGDLKLMVQSFPVSQYSNAKFFDEVVKRKYEEKKKEVTGLSTELIKDNLLKTPNVKGLKGHGFSIVGKMKDDKTLVVAYHWIEVGNSVAKVMIMGNGKTYEANTTKVQDFLKSIRMKGK